MIDPGMWDDPEFVRLPLFTQMTWIYLLTGPEARNGCPGLLRLSHGVLCDALRASSDAVDGAMRQLGDLGWVEEDRTARVVRVPNAPSYRRWDGRAIPLNALRGWYRSWSRIPRCRAKYAHVESMAAIVTSATHWQATWGQVEIPTAFREEPRKRRRIVSAQIPLLVEDSKIPRQPRRDMGAKSRRDMDTETVTDQDLSPDTNSVSNLTEEPRTHTRAPARPRTRELLHVEDTESQRIVSTPTLRVVGGAEPSPGRPRGQPDLDAAADALARVGAARRLWTLWNSLRRDLDLAVLEDVPGALQPIQAALERHGEDVLESALRRRAYTARTKAARGDERDREFFSTANLWTDSVIQNGLKCPAAPMRQKKGQSDEVVRAGDMGPTLTSSWVDELSDEERAEFQRAGLIK